MSQERQDDGSTDYRNVIGHRRATAQRLSRHPDLTVYATARRTEVIADLAEAGACILALDVTDEKSMRAAGRGRMVNIGLIRTGFGDTAAHTLAGSAIPAGPYAALNAAVHR